MSEILSGYKTKITNFNQKTKEGLVVLTCVFLLAIFRSFISNYISTFWLLFIILDLSFYYITLLFRFNFQLNDYLSLGNNSIFSTNSLVLRFARTLFYGIIVQISLYHKILTFYTSTLFLFIVISCFYVYYDIYSQKCIQNNQVTNLLRVKPYLRTITVVFALIFLGLLMRFYNMYSIFNWDEGWYADISARILQTHNYFIPLYFDDMNHTLDLFDKPPLLFIIGSIMIRLFGYSTLAVKFFVGFSSGLMGLAGYLIFNHKKESNKSDLFTNSDTKALQTEKNIAKSETDSFTSYKKVSKFKGTIFGLSMAVTWFLIYYGRTSYFDASIVAFTAFTALFAVKSIDHWFYGNRKKAYLYICLTALLNMLDLLAKAWEGLVVGPAIAIYLFIRYYGFFIPTDDLIEFIKSIKRHFRNTSVFAKIIAIFSFLLTVLLFNVLIPRPNSSLNICTREYYSKALYSTCNTFIPNLPFTISGFTIDLWSIVISFIVFFIIMPISDLLTKTIDFSSINEFEVPDKFLLNKLDDNIYKYLVYTIFGIFLILLGFFAVFMAIKFFGFFYSRFYRAFTDFFQVEYPFQGNISDLVFFGELTNGFIASILSSFFTVLISWFIFIVVISIFDSISKYFLHKRLVLERLFSKIVLEWLLLIPLLLIASGLLFWVYFLMFQGLVFNRTWYVILPVGIFLCVALFLISIAFAKFISPRIMNKLNIDNKIFNTDTWIKMNKKFLQYLTVTSIFIIISFIPFLAWIQYMDHYIVKNPYFIRIPGSLVGKGIKQGSLTYTWLFFDYYVSWRYTEIGGSYPVGGSLGWLLSPLFIACIPFFIVGIYGYFKRKDFGNLFLYGSWLFIVLFTFLPADYQLDYYYLAIFFPYFAIASEGLYWSLRKEPSFVNFSNIKLKLILGLIGLFLVFNPIVFTPYILSGLFLNTDFLYVILLASLLIVGGYVLGLKFLVRSIPEAFALSVIIFYLYFNLVVVNEHYFDTEFLIISVILIGIIIFSVRENMPLRSAIFLFILILTPVSFAIRHSNQDINNSPPFQEIGQFILDHGGNYNGSTWVLPDNGSRYAMRFYLGELPLVNDYSQYSPFSLNSSQSMLSYLKNNAGLKFFVVNNATYFKTSSIAKFSNSYLWLKEHFTLADSLVPIPKGQVIHLFVNNTVLSQSEISFLKNNQ